MASHLQWQFLYHPLLSPKTSYIDQVFSAVAATKLLQSCPTLCDPIDDSPPGSPIPGILQARTLEWVAISFSNASKWKVKMKSLSRARLLATPCAAAHGSSVHGIFQARVLEWGAIAFSQVVLEVKNTHASAGDIRDFGFNPWAWKITWSRKWKPSILAWRIPWTEEPGGLQVWQDWAHQCYFSVEVVVTEGGNFGWPEKERFPGSVGDLYKVGDQFALLCNFLYLAYQMSLQRK